MDLFTAGEGCVGKGGGQDPAAKPSGALPCFKLQRETKAKSFHLVNAPWWREEASSLLEDGHRTAAMIKTWHLDLNNTLVNE